MSQRERELELVRTMCDGEDLHINMFQDGGAHICKTVWGWVVYEIPLYGGVGMFEAHVDTPEEAVRIAYEVFNRRNKC